MEPSTPAKRPRSEIIAIVAVSAIVFFIGLGGLALIGPDEPRYAEVAREMFASGDYISTRLCGCLWFEKPALLYWLGAASYHIFGVSEFAARLPSAIAATATVVGIFFWLRRLIGRDAAFWSALVLSTSGLFVAYGRVATPDMLLTASMTLSLAAAYQASKSRGRVRLVHCAMFGIGLGLAMLAKGLVAVGLVPLIVLSHSAFLRKRKLVTWREAGVVALTFSAVAASWYAPVVARHGWHFIDEFFLKHHLQRYVSNVYGHPQPIYFFFVIVLLGVAPWSAFLAASLARLRGLKPGVGDQESLLAFAWLSVGVPVIFFSFSRSKLPGYILPVLPWLAIVVGVEVQRFRTGYRSAAAQIAGWGTVLVVSAVALGGLLFARREFVGLSGWRLLLCLIPVGLALGSAALLAAKRRGAFLLVTLLVVLAIVVGAVVVVFGPIDERTSLKPLSLDAAAALKPGERICFFIKKEFAPVFYAQGRVVCDSGDMAVLNALREDILEDALEKARQGGSDSLIVITTSNWRRGLESYPRFEAELVAQQGDALAFRVRLRP